MTDEQPICECHGEQMFWSKDSRRKSGGYWKCTVKRRDYQRKYASDNPEKVRTIRKKTYLKDIERSRAKGRARGQRYRDKDPERKRAICRKWREENPLKALIYDRRSKRRIRLLEHEQKLLSLKHEREVSA